jgi:hypothetical protein
MTKSIRTDYNCAMIYRRFKYEGWLYGLAFLLALSLRLTALGSMPLNDAESELALQALQIASGIKPALEPHPAYILFTAPSFFLYGGGTNFLARLIPALVGSALVLAPLLFAGHLKPRPALLLAFFLALDPGLTAISRQAGSPIIAVTFLAFAIGFFDRNQPRLAGGFAALALLGGPAAWTGMLGLGLAWTIARAALRLHPKARPAGDQGAGSVPAAAILHQAAFPFAVTFVLAGSLLLIVPNGLSAALASLAAYLAGWGSVSSIRAGWMLISLLAYQPLAIFLSVPALIRGWANGSRRVIPLSIWLLVSLLIALFYPAKQVADLAWTVLPLWALAALELARHLDLRPEERRETAGAVLLTLFLGVFAWLNFAGLVWLSYGMADFDLRLGLSIGSLALLVVSLLLIAFGWSMRVAQAGAVWGLGLALGALGLSGTFGTMGMRGMTKPELWWPQGIPMQAQLLEDTVDDLSEWGRGYENAVPLVIYGVRSPALEWTLRERRYEVTDMLDIAASPELVVSGGEGDPELAAAYRGQDFSWKSTTDWEIARPADWFRWLAFREMPRTDGTVILWAREDLFLGRADSISP